MAFYGSEFVFDGKSCKEFGLMLYDVGSDSQGDVKFQSVGKAQEDSIAGRYSSFFYGLEQNQSLSFTLIFGVNTDSIDHGESLNRFEIEEIASWLTGHNTRKWLQIVQPDMEGFRYKCIISELKLITHGSLPWAFSCTVTCDSPFAYTYPEVYKYDISDNGASLRIFNRSTYNGYYKPTVSIKISGGGSVSITNKSDNDRMLSFSDLPSSSLDITIDNENQIITEKNLGLSMYPYFNYNFLRLKRGDNLLQFEGKCSIEIVCEFPVNVGG